MVRHHVESSISLCHLGGTEDGGDACDVVKNGLFVFFFEHCIEGYGTVFHE